MSCRFRPCIDLHQGKVKQIVGGTLRDDGPGPTENFVSDRSPGDFAKMFRGDDLRGGHVIKLGPGNDEAARQALAAWPGGMQLGGGIDASNASEWLEAGASHVIVTSWLFEDGVRLSEDRVRELADRVGAGRIVIDLSCRRHEDGWVVATNRWQTLTDLRVDAATLDRLAPFCDEFLIHAADVEGLCGGIDTGLVSLLGEWAGCPVTYAGGVASMEDLQLVDCLGKGRVDVTVGSALDIFGGSAIRYADLVAWNDRPD
ncbi:phosphoribosylformimino-5-aminoimidazole carboxamide ribotide isomerase [Haloferula sp. A504]|uniref:phosphoribosylformimino-5-aminoimidazole carboxamide ribotide isomerase n=1 Tax=Haloferula sp. A504 TaxID=3373601 RepID=UPI0031C380AF|nr:phosphoribosylformimino-5-aminoimidazole carboxamide ribotide isomerase [Verrucomicrobiaceae bacterium E54]